MFDIQFFEMEVCSNLLKQYGCLPLKTSINILQCPLKQPAVSELYIYSIFRGKIIFQRNWRNAATDTVELHCSLSVVDDGKKVSGVIERWCLSSPRRLNGFCRNYHCQGQSNKGTASSISPLPFRHFPLPYRNVCVCVLNLNHVICFSPTQCVL